MSVHMFGGRGWVIECDPATGQPREGGRIVGCTGVEFRDGATQVVADEMLPAGATEFWGGGWCTDGSRRWRLAEESQVAVFGDGDSAQYVLSEEIFR